MIAKPRIAVIGAGIVGASIAYHLARRGAAVTLLDAGRPAGAVTRQAFAWINVSHGLAKPYSQLRHLAIQDYRRLERELGGALRVDWCGALTWNRDLAETERFVREHVAWGYDVRLVERDEIALLEPGLLDPPACAAFAGSEGAVDPQATTEVLAAAAEAAGATLRFDCPVLGAITRGDAVTGLRTAGGDLAADLVVLAAGVGSTALAAPLGIALPVRPSPSILLRLRSRERLVRTILSGSGMEVRHGGDGLLLAAEDYIDDSPENGPDAVARRALATIRATVKGAGEVLLDSVAVGQRPMPGDEAPILGYPAGLRGLYLASMHAGVTMAPVVGRLAAAEILDGIEVRVFDSCRLERFAPVASDVASP